MTGWEEVKAWELPQLEAHLVPHQEAPLPLRTMEEGCPASPFFASSQRTALSWEVG